MAEVSAVFSNNINRPLTDFNILSKDDKKFPCHRVILASQSPVILAMMTNNWKERQENQITLQESDEVVEHFVEYFYTRKVPRKVLESNLASFFELSGQYDLTPLKLLTEETAIGMFSVENMVDLYILGNLHSADLKSEAETFIRRNKKELKKMDLSGFPHSVVTDLLRLLI